LTGVPQRLRSLLFAPASRPDVCLKLPRSGPDGVVIDLEDAVPPDGKADAREHARSVGSQLAADHPGLAVYVRVNAVPSEWFERDVREALNDQLAGVVVPKLESAEQVDAVAGALAAAGLSGLHVLAGIETAAGVAHADAVMRGPVAAAYFGAEDFISDMGGVRTESNTEVLYARSRVALAARIAGVHPIDQIVATIDDDARFRTDAREALAIGYRGKLCIHPSQVPLANDVFSPSPEAVTHARALLSLYEEAQATGQQVVVFEGQMIDEALARRARAILAAAELEEG
jgi:citrate lyase subunit beta/citryl-CoA lyase